MTASSDTSRQIRRLMAAGLNPVWFTASEKGAEPEQHVYDLVEMTDERPRSGAQVFLGFRVSNLDGNGRRGDLYRCTDDPVNRRVVAERVLDCPYALRPIDRVAGAYRMDTWALADYAEDLLKAGLAATRADAVARAIDNADRADFIFWNRLRDELLEFMDETDDEEHLAICESVSTRLPSYFRDQVVLLTGVDEDLPEGGEDGWDISAHRLILTTFLLAFMGQNLAEEALAAA